MTTMARVVASLVMIPLLVDSFVGPQVTRVPVSLETHEENISISYCTGCRWMLRSAWMAQELLTTFQDELDSVTLIPSRPPAPGGVFVRLVLLKVLAHEYFHSQFCALFLSDG
jgi:hypothetical protein